MIGIPMYWSEDTRTNAQKRKVRRHNKMISVLKEFGLKEALRRGYDKETATRQYKRIHNDSICSKLICWFLGLQY